MAWGLVSHVVAFPRLFSHHTPLPGKASGKSQNVKNNAIHPPAKKNHRTNLPINKHESRTAQTAVHESDRFRNHRKNRLIPVGIRPKKARTSRAFESGYG